MKKQLIIIGGGFAGFWSAMSAIRQAREISKDSELEITLINPDNYFTMRPRLYEVSLEGTRVALDQYLAPLGIRQIMGRAESINPELNSVMVATAQGMRSLSYEYLILATGSVLRTVNIPGIEHSFNVDQYAHALTLENHLISIAENDLTSDRARTIVISGAGFTGLETVTTIQEKANAILKNSNKDAIEFEVILIEKNPALATNYSEEARDYIEQILKSKDIKVIAGVTITKIATDHIQLSDGQTIKTNTVIWTGGMLANQLTNCFRGVTDEHNRLQVDDFLKLPDNNNIIIAGDVARAKVDEHGNESLMACQFAMFQGKWAGHNAVNDIFSKPLKPYRQPNYLTCLDLGQKDALVTAGWNRKIYMTGEKAKNLKKEINGQWIYPLPDVEATVRASTPEIPEF